MLQSYILNCKYTSRTGRHCKHIRNIKREAQDRLIWNALKIVSTTPRKVSTTPEKSAQHPEKSA